MCVMQYDNKKNKTTTIKSKALTAHWPKMWQLVTRNTTTTTTTSCSTSLFLPPSLSSIQGTHPLVGNLFLLRALRQSGSSRNICHSSQLQYIQHRKERGRHILEMSSVNTPKFNSLQYISEKPLLMSTFFACALPLLQNTSDFPSPPSLQKQQEEICGPFLAPSGKKEE